jgi:hypothetical protein
MVDSLLNPKSSRNKDSAGEHREIPAPLRRRQPNGLIRSIGLGAVAVAFSVYWLGRSFAVDWAEIRFYLTTSLLFVGVFIGAALLVWVVVRLLPRLLKRWLGR